MATDTIIELLNVKKVYQMGKENIHAVNNVSFSINRGEFCCLFGASGSGKSTLLNLMAGIETATSGSILVKGKEIGKMSESGLAMFRQRNLGFVFQGYNLIPTMTALENVELPFIFQQIPAKKRRKQAVAMLKKVGLGNRLMHKPSEMSGGQQQRVGIARAFVGKPGIVFADETTGNLDTKTSKEVMDLIKQMAKENSQTIVMVTHDWSLASYADKVIHISDGTVYYIEEPKKKAVVPPKEKQPEQPAKAPEKLPVVELPEAEPAEELPIEEPIEELPEDEPAEELPVVELPEAEQVEELPVEEPIEELPEAEPVEELPVEEPIEELLEAEPAEELPVEEPIEELPEAEPVEELPVEEPIEELPEAEPVEALPVEKPTVTNVANKKPALVKKLVVKRISMKELYQGTKKGKRG